MDESLQKNEVEKRSLAIEGALIMLVNDLAMRGVVSADEAEEVLKTISRSSELSAARTSGSIALVQQLRNLRRGDGRSAPGARGA